MTRARAGFTLMELVVSLAITGLVAAAAAGTFASVIDSRSRSREVAHQTAGAAATRGMLVAWLSSGRVSIQAGRGPTLGAMGYGELDDQVLVTATAATPLTYNETAVRLFIDRDDFTPEYGLVAELQPVSVEASGASLQTTRLVQLDSSVTGLQVEYLDPTTRMWVTRSQSIPRNPMAMRMTLFADGPDTLPSLLQLPIMQPLIPARRTAR
jgi:prepilin-type N-terminal cleavage/methylation domain-containing protein